MDYIEIKIRIKTRVIIFILYYNIYIYYNIFMLYEPLKYLSSCGGMNIPILEFILSFSISCFGKLLYLKSH